MTTLRQVTGAVLILIGALVAIHTVVEPLYHASSQTSPYRPQLELYQPADGDCHSAGPDLQLHAQARGRPGRRQCTGNPCLSGCQHDLLRVAVHRHPLFLQLVQPAEPCLQRRGARRRFGNLGSDRRRPAAAPGGSGCDDAERRQISSLGSSHTNLFRSPFLSSARKTVSIFGRILINSPGIVPRILLPGHSLSPGQPACGQGA